VPERRALLGGPIHPPLHRVDIDKGQLMLRSRANTLVSVRRVTQVNVGRKTAGIDGQVALFSEVRAELAEWIQRESGPWKAQPVKRVYIPDLPKIR
jgi:retron-type reverse transcriptase